MLRHNLLSSIRHIRRNLSFSILNILGLSLGLTLILILCIWLQFELSFDKFNENASKIFRVVSEIKTGTGTFNFIGTPAALGDMLKKQIPEITDYVRITGLGSPIVNYGNVQFREDISLADPSIFRIFSFHLVSGDPESALKEPHSIIMSRSKARKYFGTKNPIGQTIQLVDYNMPFTVTGVLEDIPPNSQIQFDFLASFSEYPGNMTWGIKNFHTYILTKRSDSFKSINEKLADVIKGSPDEDYKIHLQPLTSIHLHSNLHGELPTNTSIKTVYFISTVLFLILIVGCINYINMTTARYTRRGKEAGLRKVAGATNINLTIQFLFESLLITCIAFILAFFLSFLLLPLFVSLTGLPLQFDSIINFRSALNLVFLILIIAFIAGFYPAFMLSSVNPVKALRDDFRLGKTVSIKGLRKGLVIFQFLVSIILIACTMIIRLQMEYVRNKNLGIDAEQVIVIPIFQAEVRGKYELYKKEILNSPYILSASAVGYSPGKNYNQNAWWEGLELNDYNHFISWIPVDQDFIKTLRIEITRGENFPQNMTARDTGLYILNETAIAKSGWDEPLGKQFEISGIGKGHVIGIVKDFNFRALYNEMEPMALTNYHDAFDNLLVRITTSNIPGTITFLKEKWKSLYPRSLFEFSFLSDDFQKLYEKENLTLKLITWISLFSLFISCIGLFGLVLFTIDRRLKEIGIRKVSGSSSGEIIIMLNMEFIRWILAAFLISVPIITILMNKWLQGFAYKISLPWWMIAFAGLVVLLLSLLTISWHTLYSATRNPAECLRHE
jgi:putative ABC transport system permease protein